MEKQTAGKTLSGFGLLLLGFAFVLFIGAMPKFTKPRPVGESWEISLPTAIVGIICTFVGLKLNTRRRRR